MLKHVPVSKTPFTLTVAAFLSCAFFGLGSAVAYSQTSAETFKTNCVMCHGADGAGTALGKRLQVVDLRSKKIQDQSSAALAQVISKGKDNMPPFGASLDAKQIDKLVQYIRRFRASVPATTK